jgi:ribonuclease BN (tRNA processing enzyme)
MLFISHLHLDHLYGLHTLPLFRFPQGIDIFVPKAMEKPLRGFLRRPFTSTAAQLPVKLRFHAIDPETARFPFSFGMLRLRHSVPCYGYRIGSGAQSVAYCTDTGACPNLGRLAAGAGLLITECAMAPGDTGPNLFHITPETAARAAASGPANRLALFHFDPGKYPSFAERLTAESAAKRIFPETVAARDGTTIRL